MAIKTAAFSVNNFINFTQGLLNVIQKQNLSNYNFSLYCIDVKDVTINNNGRRNLKAQFMPVNNEKGVYIFFDKRKLQVLYVGAAGLAANGQFSVFYTTTGGSGRVPQHLSGNRTTSPIIDYFYKNRPNATKKSYTRFINLYSIMFICMSPSSNANFVSQLASFESSLIKYLKPIVQ